MIKTFQITFAFLMIALTCTAFANNSPNHSISADNLSFIIMAKEGELKPIANGHYQLLLAGVNPYTTYYTRRPNRNSGLAATINFIRSWSVGYHSFHQDHPNAALIAATIDGTINSSGTARLFTIASLSYNFSRSEMQIIMAPIDHNNQMIIKHINYSGVSLVIN